ncbi:uncharacterized protein LOC134460851 [Engraulis encrasicolus]|uniref:uncharacterized protein LOC134460851 n=1 Tax=Engraulis encrasicolus TaxID=184585 RepID=UPI002FD1D536
MRQLGIKDVRQVWVMQAVILMGLVCDVTPLDSSDEQYPWANGQWPQSVEDFVKNWDGKYNVKSPPYSSYGDLIPNHTGPDGKLTEAINNLRQLNNRMANPRRYDPLEENLGKEGAVLTTVAIGIVLAQLIVGSVIYCAVHRCKGRSVDRRGALVRGQQVTIGSENVDAPLAPPSAPMLPSVYAGSQQGVMVTAVTSQQPAETTAYLLPAPQGPESSSVNLLNPQDKTCDAEGVALTNSIPPLVQPPLMPGYSYV